MAAAASDKFTKVYQRLTTTLASDKAIAAASMALSSATNWPTDTGVIATVYDLAEDGTIDTSTAVSYAGVVSGSNITNLAVVEGTDRLHSAGATVSLLMTATHLNRMVEGILAEHKQTGAHGDITADSVTSTGNIETTTGAVITDTISEKTAANGVDIDGLNIKDGFVTGGSGTGVKNASLDTTAGELGGAWQSWTPTLTNLNIGTTGTADYKYIQIGKTVHFRVHIIFGGTGISVGDVRISLPITSATHDGSRTPIALAVYEDASPGAQYNGRVWLSSTTEMRPIVEVASTTYSSTAVLSSTVPMTWAAADRLFIHGFYEAA